MTIYIAATARRAAEGKRALRARLLRSFRSIYATIARNLARLRFMLPPERRFRRLRS